LINGLILDLRNNPGGFLNETLTMANYFIGDKIVLQVDDKNSRNIEKLYSSTHSQNYWFLSPPPLISEKVIVLTNSHSASAAEILSGILKSYNRAIIVGDEHTYGKGSIQNLIQLRSYELGLLKISTNVYFLADGTTPQFEGVKSDIVIPSETTFSDVYEKNQTFTLKPKHKFQNEVSDDFDTVSKPILQILKNQSKKRVDSNTKFSKYKDKKKLEEFFKNSNFIDNDKEDLVLSEALEILKDLLEIKDDY
jgi:carboxyl-terminal processing protease